MQARITVIMCFFYHAEYVAIGFHNIGSETGGTRGTCPPPPLVRICPSVNCLGLPVTDCRVTWQVALQKTLRAGILAASSLNINLSTNMASEAISEHLFFSGGACPQTPIACAHTIIGAPPNLKCLPNHPSPWVSPSELGVINPRRPYIMC